MTSSYALVRQWQHLGQGVRRRTMYVRVSKSRSNKTPGAMADKTIDPRGEISRCGPFGGAPLADGVLVPRRSEGSARSLG